jgi:hypothetical protein
LNTENLLATSVVITEAIDVFALESREILCDLTATWNKFCLLIAPILNALIDGLFVFSSSLTSVSSSVGASVIGVVYVGIYICGGLGLNTL